MLGKFSLFIEISLNKSYQTEKDKELHDKVIWQERAEKTYFPQKHVFLSRHNVSTWNEMKTKFVLSFLIGDKKKHEDEDKTQLYTTNSNQWLTKNYF